MTSTAASPSCAEEIVDLQLEDKVVIVTGGAKGIGAAIAESFAQEGARIAILTRPSRESDSFAENLARRAEVLYVPVDLSEAHRCEAAVAAVRSRFERIDVLVNNAGVNDGASLEAGIEKFEASLRANLVHLYAMVHFALPDLKASRGNIVNIGSKVAETGQGGTSGYAASKGGVNALTREWAVDLAPFLIRSNAIIPAECMTPLYRTWLDSLPDPEERLARIVRHIPLGQRMTLASEIADTAVFIASPCSAHTTGQIIHVDGGYTHLDRACTAT
jgi:NAD(P)-dependent dehydrogenase (short-subunit alcohol dehydrogenase family)